MGNFAINIQGVGQHHNRPAPQDVDVMAAEFTKQLIAAGHFVEKATVTYGGKEEYPNSFSLAKKSPSP